MLGSLSREVDNGYTSLLPIIKLSFIFSRYIDPLNPMDLEGWIVNIISNLDVLNHFGIVCFWAVLDWKV